MTAEQFAYWMQGFAELTGDAPPTKAQWKSMREHLATVFHKVTPPVRLPGVLPSPTQYPAAPSWKPPYTVECSAVGDQITATLTC